MFDCPSATPGLTCCLFSKCTYVAAPISHGGFLSEDKTSLYAPHTELHKHVYTHAQQRIVSRPKSEVRKVRVCVCVHARVCV